MKKKASFKQIVAIIGIVLLVGLYIASLIVALISKNNAITAIRISVAATIVVPAWIYLMIMFSRLTHRNDKPDEIIYADDNEDPFTDEDFNEEE